MQILNRTEYSDRLSFPGEQLANVFFDNFFKSTNRKVKTNGPSFMSGCLLKRRGVFSSANASWKFIFQFNIRNISFNMELLGYGSRPFPFHPFPVPCGFHAILLRFCVQNLLQPISHVTLRKKYRQLFWYELDRGVSLWQQRVLRGLNILFRRAVGKYPCIPNNFDGGISNPQIERWKRVIDFSSGLSERRGLLLFVSKHYASS